MNVLTKHQYALRARTHGVLLMVSIRQSETQHKSQVGHAHAISSHAKLLQQDMMNTVGMLQNAGVCGASVQK